MRKILVLSSLLAGVTAGPAVGHVEVLPATVTQNTFTEFTARVPTERDVATTAVRITFPPQVTVSKFAAPPAGWTLRETLADDGRTTGVVYRGGTIGVGRYVDFAFLGVGFDTGTTIWKATQTYADGEVKAWTGPPEVPGDEGRDVAFDGRADRRVQRALGHGWRSGEPGDLCGTRGAAGLLAATRRRPGGTSGDHNHKDAQQTGQSLQEALRSSHALTR